MRRLVVTPRLTLTHPVDHEARMALFPAAYTIKGMFFSRIVRRLGKGWDEVQKKLSAPPRLGRYLPFSDYPQSDYARIVAFAVGRLYPTLPSAESLRRVARSDIEILCESTIGRVVMAALRDPGAALLRLPDIYRVAQRGGAVTTEPMTGGVRISFAEWYSQLDSYMVGNVEGLVMHYGVEPTITVDMASESSGTFEVQWR